MTMPNLALLTLQARGKVRRFVQSNILTRRNQSLLARRQGDCNRCGECCAILFRCPFLKRDEEGQTTCRIYDQRFTQCRLFPLHPRDLKEVAECSYTFAGAEGAVEPVESAAKSIACTD
jgi:hypothetical protein